MLKNLLAAFFLRSAEGYNLTAFLVIAGIIPMSLTTFATGPNFTVDSFEWMLATGLCMAGGVVVFLLSADLIVHVAVKCMHAMRYVTGNKQIMRKQRK